MNYWTTLDTPEISPNMNIDVTSTNIPTSNSENFGKIVPTATALWKGAKNNDCWWEAYLKYILKERQLIFKTQARQQLHHFLIGDL